MSVSSEIQRIKTNIANAYTELESKGATIPANKNSDNLASTITTVTTGGGASINGVLVPKTVASGSVSKGDFVVATEQVKISKCEGEDYILSSTSGASFLDKANVLDDDDTTYMSVNGNTYNISCRFKFPNYEQLGIPANALVTKIEGTCIHANPKSKNYTYLYLRKYSNFTNNGSFIIGQNTSCGTGAGTNIYTDKVLCDLMCLGSYIENIGMELYSGSNATGVSTRVYKVELSITYLDDGIVKTVTTTADTLVGVANSDGVEGDTIDVYVPGVVEEGVSYMNRMMEMVEESQAKAQAYDILTGEVE